MRGQQSIDALGRAEQLVIVKRPVVSGDRCRIVNVRVARRDHQLLAEELELLVGMRNVESDHIANGVNRGSGPGRQVSVKVFMEVVEKDHDLVPEGEDLVEVLEVDRNKGGAGC